MADAYHHATGIPVAPLLKRVRATKYQSSLVRTMRVENVANCFQLDMDLFEMDIVCHRHLILVDDLCTTGATLVAAARELAILKPKSLVAAVICRAF